MNALVQAAVQVALDRRKFIGGSDIAAVIGLSPWKTRVELYTDKITPRVVENRDNVTVKRRGKRWEGVVAEMLVEDLEAQGYKVEIVASNLRYIDPELDFLACEIDFEIRLDGKPEIINVELKTVHPFKAKEWGESGSDDLPTHYTAQAMLGLSITRRRLCIVAALFGADELKTYPVVYDEATVAGLRRMGSDFWLNHVVPRIPPAPETLNDLKALFPKEFNVPALIADAELVEKALRLRTIDRQQDALQGERDLIEFQIQRAMGTCGELIVNGKSAATWKDRPYEFVDKEDLKARFPQVLKQVIRRGSSRVFALKRFAWDR